jgi:hypothetical protein
MQANLVTKSCGVFLSLLVAGAISLGQSGQTQSTAGDGGDSGPTIEDVRADLQKRTQLPVRLPRFLPETGGAPIYAAIRHADATSYEVVLATDLPCEGQNNCSYGRVDASTGELEAPEGPGTSVVITKYVRGKFYESHCHAYCSNAYIRWKEMNITFSIGVKAGTKVGLLKAARSVFDR